ncbi:hypothetical protein TQ38_026390 (plasmid) [Novosphingobium sp. P6W]|nr:hypothetical protein TQ38_026390 [Novosphingobium sp. P6W]
MLIVAVGDFGLNIYWRSISYFLLFFYTDVVGLSVASASVIYMIASIVDGCIDPIIGMVIDRTRTRWGRYRPWIAMGSVPLALSFCLLYWVPSAGGTALVVLVTGAHILFRACYTSVAVPVASLTARVTTDSRERTTLTGYRLLCGTTAGLVVAFCTQPVSAWLGRTQGEGFFWVAALSGILATAVFMLVAIGKALGGGREVFILLAGSAVKCSSAP